MVKKIDLLKIKEKELQYDSFRELRLDIAWFVHNCLIEFPSNDEICQNVKTLPKFIENEILSVTKCAECYENAYQHPDTSFTIPCEQPHLLLWVEAPGWSFWPAKAMSSDGNLVHVRFFQDHTILDIPSTSCYQFTDPEIYYPGGKLSTSREFKAAIEVSSLVTYF